MLSLKLVRSLVLGETITPSQHPPWPSKWQLTAATPSEKEPPSPPLHHQLLLLFVPTNELISDSFRLATIARDIGMNISTSPSLSTLSFSWPHHPFCSLSNPVPLPFPSLSSASPSQLRRFCRLSRNLFRLVHVPPNSPILRNPNPSPTFAHNKHSLSLFSRLTRDHVRDMDRFARILAGNGWSMFRIKHFGFQNVCLFRKVDASRVRVCWDGKESGRFRVRELTLPHLDLGNAPVEILQYIVLMTEDIFYLG